MADPKKTELQSKPPAAAKSGERKRWIKKTPLDVVAEQGTKLREEVKKLEEELKEKRIQLQKFEEFLKSASGG